MKIWIDTETGTWGGDIDTIYAVDINDISRTNTKSVLYHIDRMTDAERIILARSFGVQLRMLGCEDNPTRDLDDRPPAESGHSESYVNDMRDAGRGHLL